MGIQDKAQSLSPRDTLAATHAPAQRLSSRQFYFGTEMEESLGYLIKRLQNISCHPKGQFSDRWISRYNLIHNLEVKFDDRRVKRLCYSRGEVLWLG